MKNFWAFIGMLVLVASPVQAQLASGMSGFSSAPTSASEAEYWIMMRRLGACLADSKKGRSIEFLSTTPGSPEEDAAFQTLFHRNTNRCMGNFVSANMLRAHIRGSIAEGLFELMPSDRRAEGLSLGNAAPKTVTSLHDFAACYVGANQADAIQFLNETKVGSKGEVAAIRQMVADFSPCLPVGAEVQIVPIDIRMAIAEALFHSANRHHVSNSQVSQ